MIDENGKLFGKINLIDLIVVILIIALLAFVALKVIGGQNDAPVLTAVEISFFSDEVPDYVADYIHEGDKALDSAEDVNMGTVKSVMLGAPISYLTDIDGQTREVEKNGYCSVNLTIDAVCQMTENGAMIDGTLYGVGHTMVLYAGQAKLWVKVSGITPVA